MKSNDNDPSSSHRPSASCLREKSSQTSWKEFIARNINWDLKSEIQLVYPRWPLSDAVSAEYSSFSRRSIFGYYRFRVIE